MLKKINLKKNKTGLSEMIGYVLLISIAVGIASGVYVWMKYFPEIIQPKTDCKKGTSISLENIECSNNLARFIIKNNGLFQINGVIVKVSSNESIKPLILLESNNALLSPGNYQFINNFGGFLKPGESAQAIFNSRYYNDVTKKNEDYIGEIKSVQIQAFIIDKNKVVCSNAIITQPVDCKINQIV